MDRGPGVPVHGAAKKRVRYNWSDWTDTESLTLSSLPLIASSVAATCFLSVIVFIFYYGFHLSFSVPHVSKRIHYLSLCIWLISLSTALSSSIHVVSSKGFPSFSWQIMFIIYTYIPGFPYPLSTNGHLYLLSYFGYYK